MDIHVLAIVCLVKIAVHQHFLYVLEKKNLSYEKIKSYKNIKVNIQTVA